MDVNHLGELLEISGYAIISIDSGMNLTFANKHAHRILGYEKKIGLGSESPVVIDTEWISDNMKNLLGKDKVPINSVVLKDGRRLEVDGFVAGLFNGGDNLIGLSIFMKQSTPQQRDDSNVKKRTFENIRLLILATLIGRRKTINQISSDIGVNWKTVENHLTYLVGKRLIKEVFSSKYVRIFEITVEGRTFARENSITGTAPIINDIENNNLDVINSSTNDYDYENKSNLNNDEYTDHFDRGVRK